MTKKEKHDQRNDLSNINYMLVLRFANNCDMSYSVYVILLRMKSRRS